MYPRNAASPPKVSIGAVVQISDGTVQTSGCTVRVLTGTGAEGDGGGTTAYSTDGIVLYTPTQAETDATSFVLIVKKTGCIPISQTVVTVAGATAGKATLETDQAVNVTKVGGTAQTAGDILGVWTPTKAGYLTGDSYAVLTNVNHGNSALKALIDDVPTVSEFNARSTSDPATATNQTTILNRIGAITGTGVNTVLGFFKALLNKAATLPSDIGGTFDQAADSTEAIRDRGDAAWGTATGFPLASDWTATRAGKVDNLDATISSRGTGTALDAAGVRSAVGLASANLDTQLDAIPTAAEIKTAMEVDGSKVSDTLASLGNATYGLSAIRSRGDSAWATATGFSTHSVADILAGLVDGALTVKQSLMVCAAVLAGNVSGNETETVTITGAGNATVRVTSTVDGNGNRNVSLSLV